MDQEIYTADQEIRLAHDVIVKRINADQRCRVLEVIRQHILHASHLALSAKHDIDQAKLSISNELDDQDISPKIRDEYFKQSLKAAEANIYDMYSDKNIYYLIYDDKSEVITSDDALVAGNLVPDFSRVVYAMCHTESGQEVDSEIGFWPFYPEYPCEKDDEEYKEELEARMSYDDYVRRKYKLGQR